MKIRKILLLPLLFVSTLTTLVSCGVDRWAEYAVLTEFDEWIAATMRQNYLWYNELPADKELNFFLEPEAFLKTVVSKKEDLNMSFIDTIRQTPPLSYGFDYSLYRKAGNDTAYHALVTYVLPQSPASRAGLKRGQWIMKVDNEVITKKSELKLMNSGQAIDLLLGKYARQIDEETEEEIGVVIETGSASMNAKEAVEKNPVNYHTVITTSNGIKVGYLVYSHFTAGTAADSQAYNNQLRALSQEFAHAGVTQFVLDLRYNTGGTLECAQLLSSLLAPAEALDTPFAELMYNDKQTSKNHELLFDRALIGTGANLNIQRGYVLTSNTTAGVSGTMMNCLFPLNKWSVVGSPLACHGVATEAFTHPKFLWTLNPVVCNVHNSQGDTNRGMTLSAEVTTSETTNLLHFLPFGDEKEALLGVALGLIDGTYLPPTTPSR